MFILDQKNMKPVESSNLKALHYDEVEKKLYIKFHNARIFVYFKVPEQEYLDLYNAPSCGKKFHISIKGKYDCEEYRD